MFCTLFGVLTVTDLQSAGLIADWVPFLFALPAFCVSALYPWKAALAAGAAMVILAFVFQGLQGLLLLVPYVIAGAIIGLGSRKGWKRSVLLLGSALVLSIAALAQYTLFAALFGYTVEMLTSEFSFLNGILQPYTLLVVLAVFMGSLQGLLLVMLGFLLERRLPRYFGMPQPFGFWKPTKGWAAAFLIWSLVFVAGVVLMHVSAGLRDVLLLVEVVLFGVMVFAGWLFFLPVQVVWRPWKRLLATMAVWIVPLNLAYAGYGLYHLLKGDRASAVFRTRS